MSAEENKAVVRRFFDELANGRRAELADELLTPDSAYIDPQIPNVVGPKAIVQTFAVFQVGVEGHWGVDEVLAAEDDRVVARWTGTGRHTGEVMGIPPTGNAVNVSAISLFRLEDGKIAEHRIVWDTLSFLRQVGVVPAAG